MAQVEISDSSTLSSLEFLFLRGGEITARFHISMQEEEWLNFDNIKGKSDGSVDRITVSDSWIHELVVIGGFDAGSIDDKLVFDFPSWSGIEISSLADLIWSVESDNIRINYREELGYAGSIVLLGVGSTFDATENLLFV